MAKVFLLHGLKEYQKAYELDSFADVFPDFESAKNSVIQLIENVKKEFSDCLFEEEIVEVEDDDETIYVSLFSIHSIRFECRVFSKELALA